MDPTPRDPQPACSSDPESPEPRYRGFDRRKRPTPRFSKYAVVGGRRRAIRRADEREGGFVDLYSPALLCALGWIVLLNLADTFFTLVHLQAGGIELNPVADMLLRTGRIGFVLWKSALIGVALLILCVHKNFILARVGIWTAAGTYTLLVLYHLALFRAH